MSIFKIQIKAGTPAVFDPNPLTIYVNDSVFWFNDDQQAHWPAPSASNPKGFLQFQVPPNTSSSQVSFGTAKTISYVCVHHPAESGTIIVLPGKKKKAAFGGNTNKGSFGAKTTKGAFGGKTKKGAFGGKTKKGAFGDKTKKGAFGDKTKKRGLGGHASKGRLC